MLKSKRRWRIQQTNHELIEQFVTTLEITPLIASLLINRGITTIESAEEFLKIDQEPFHDPFLLDGMDKTVERIKQAIEQNEKIMIYGDYDADGVSSTSVLLSALTLLGAEVDFYIPNRFTEGYGPNEQAFRSISEQGYTLVITVDTGISAVNEASLAKELGFDLIITDHHEPGPQLPEAYTIIHPKKPGSIYPFKELAGVGVAFKLAHALLGEAPEHLLELAVIGTIADLVPLQGENRLIASKGLRYLQRTNRPGLQALLRVCGIKQEEVNEDTIGFAIGPRINAVGRLQSADPAVQLLMTTNETEAKELAEEIDELNKERQQLVNEMTEEAVSIVERLYPPEQNGVLVIAQEGWNAGVVGIVASRLVDRFYRPTIVLSIDQQKGVAKGSARSIEGFDLFANLSTCRDILPHFGGHPMAAGMTLQIKDVDDLRNRLNTLAYEKLTEEDFIPITTVDTVCKVEDITLSAIEQLRQLAPFGMSNSKPKIMVENVNISSIRKIGADQTHLKLTFEDEGMTVDGVGFGLGRLYDEISPISKISLVGELTINEWNNMRKPQLMIEDIGISEWQLFDYRSARSTDQFFKSMFTSEMTVVYFSEDTITEPEKQLYKDHLEYIDGVESASRFEAGGKQIVLLDLPPSMELVNKLFMNGIPSRIYTAFLSKEDHYFHTVPTRDHFKWYYGFLVKNSPFDLNRYKEDLAIHKGWSKDTIDFMSQVFFELEFVTIKNGLISLMKNGAKRDLIESATYRRKQEQIQLEKKFLYTSYGQLKQLFDDVISSCRMNEEATN
ncbi:single-stranded-DNA-specific exonuclease RecJ [Priestia abyssalis]|uniref:single-stranded-DNA-specific exonuclease RecJ n=1 Tax=Priestia abyssalis TaxID=1221450 RepID=UPI000994C8C4|nr:single-stranded-DNA-specific exonuclease RecJ [Priestia abyssalis]